MSDLLAEAEALLSSLPKKKTETAATTASGAKSASTGFAAASNKARSQNRDQLDLLASEADDLLVKPFI